MNKIAVLALGLISVVGCSSPSRAPSSANDFVTRDGNQVPIPGLRVRLSIPVCEANRKSLDECAAPDETALFEEITKTSFAFQSVQNPPSEKTSQREFHAKHHACLAGKWTPLKKVPREMAVGAFSLKKPAPIVLRYSNGSPKSPTGNGMAPPDAFPDARGLALKIVGIPGDSILDVEDGQTGVMNQDFVLINHPAFFLRNPKAYPQFLTLIAQGKPFFHIMDSLELSTMKATNRVVADVSAETFFSQTPYALGAQKAKYRVRPCLNEAPQPLAEEETKNPRFLRARIATKLKKAPLCLIFSAQVRTEEMDVEDAAVEWANPVFVDLAKIEIPKNQDINDPERDSFCENISFNPWNSQVENRPAGAINRARLAVYTGISRKRRLENQIPIAEPKASDKFFNVLKLK